MQPATERRAPAPDRQQREVDRTAQVGHPVEQVGVAGEVHRCACRAARTRVAGAVGPSGGRKPEWRAGTAWTRDPADVDRRRRPRSRRRAPKPAPASHGPAPAGDEDRDGPAEVAQRRHVEVVPVEVRQEDEVDAAQRSMALRHRHDALERPDPCPRRRVGQDADPVELDEQRRMSDELDRQRHEAASGVRIEPDPPERLAPARARDEVGPLRHLVLQPPDVGVLRRQLDRLGRATGPTSIASSVSRIAASRGSISSEKIEVRLDCICGMVLLLRT